MCFFNNTENTIVFFADLAGFEPQHHKLVKFKESNICYYGFGIFERLGYLMGNSKYYFADAYKCCQYYLKH